jgi:diacylglycerol kinase (ATP)
MNRFFNFRKMTRSFVFSAKGIVNAALNEQNFRFHLLFIIPVIIAALYLSLKTIEWGFIIISIFLVLVSEMFNTALERLCDKLSRGKRNRKIAFIKDVSAGAVLLSAVNAVIIGIIFILIPLVRKLFVL